MQRTDVVIVGGGFLGLSVAYSLLTTGLAVTLLEKEHQPGMHASGKNAGMIRHAESCPDLTEWVSRSIAAWPASLRDRHFTPSGSLIVGAPPLQSHPELFAPRTVAVRIGAERSERPAVFTARDGLIDAASFIRDFGELTVAAGLTLRTMQGVCRIESNGAHDLTVRTDRSELRAAHVVLAPGSGLDSIILPDAALSRSMLKPFARELFVFDHWEEEDPAIDSVGFYWDEQHGWYTRGLTGRRRLVSICEQVAVRDPASFHPSGEMLATVRRKLQLHGPPGSSTMTLLRSWHCFRTFSTDTLPVVGDDPGVPGIIWCAGFGGFGMSTGFAAGEAVARHLSGAVDAIPVPFRAVRFAPGRP